MLVLVLLGVFAPNVLSQSTNSGGTAAPAVVEPQYPGDFVPEEIPTTLAKAREYALEAAYGLIVVVATDVNWVQHMFVWDHKGTLEAGMRAAAQSVALSEVFNTNLTHQIVVTAVDKAAVGVYANTPWLYYRHDNKKNSVAASQVAEKLVVNFYPDKFGVIEVVMPWVATAHIRGEDMSGKTVHMDAASDGGTSPFLVKPNFDVGAVRLPIPLTGFKNGVLVVSNQFMEAHHFELPSGRFIGTFVERSVSISPIASEPGRVQVTVRGKIGETVQVFAGPSPEYMVRQLHSDKHLFIQPGGTLRLKIDAKEDASFFKALYFSSQEEAQRSLKR